MGHEMCGHCNTVPCECEPRVIPAVGIEGDDDNARLVVGSVIPERRGIAPDPVTGQGCVRGVPHPSPHGIRDKTEEWDMGKPICRLPGDIQEPFGQDVGAEIIMEKPRIGSKDTNPKDAVGIKKWRQFTTIPFTVLWELGVAMLEGARKYGRHNYRVAGVRGSVYIDAAKGHLDCWWEGEDLDPDSGLSHIVKAIASLTVLRDAMIQDKFVDDRPPKTKNLEKVKADLQAVVDRIFENIPEAKPAFLEGDQHDV